jgi:iron complex outermembrane recepter protein
MKVRNALYLAASLMALSSVSSIARAETPDSEASDGADIIVTARLRDENIQDVPLAIQALSSEEIERKQLGRLEDLNRVVAGFTYDIGAFPNDTRVAIRGMEAERGRPSVAILLDGQDLSNENLAIAGGGSGLEMNLFDLERIEVVKGPQATLYGRNAFAGAINYISKAPSFDFGAQVTGKTATGGLIGIKGSITGPIIRDILAFRINGNYRDSDGYYRNPVNGGRLGAQHSEGFAASLLFTPVTGVKMTARFQHNKDRASDNPTAFVQSNTRIPVPAGTFAPFPGGPSSPCPPSLTGAPANIATACTRGTYIGTLSARESDIQMGNNPLTNAPPFGMRTTQNIVSTVIEWDTGGFGTFHYDFGYLKNRSEIEQDGDFSSLPAPPGLVLSVQALEELQYRNQHTDHNIYWTLDRDRFNLLLGYQRYDEKSTLRNASQFWLRNPASPLGGPPFFLNRAPSATFAYPATYARDTGYSALFGSIGVEPIKGLTINAQGRYNKDRITYDMSGWRLQDVSLSQLRPVCPSTFAQGASFNPNLPAFIPQPTPGTIVACPQTVTLKYNKFTPRVTIDYRWNDNLLTYLSWSKGFKPGGANTNEVISFTGQTFLPENVTTIEAGIKSNWLNNKLIINLDAYRNRYKDQQIGVQNTAIGGGGTLITTAGIINAGRVNTWGIEADLSLRVMKSLTLSANYAYTDAKFARYIEGPRPGSTAADFTACGVPFGQTSSDQFRAEAGNVCADLSGNRAPKSSKHALNLSGLWRHEFSDKASLFAEVDATYRSSRFIDDSNLVTLPSTWLAGARVGAEIQNYSITLYVDNIFNSHKTQSGQRVVDFANPEGFAPGRAYIAYLPKPRVFGLQIGAKF